MIQSQGTSAGEGAKGDGDNSKTQTGLTAWQPAGGFSSLMVLVQVLKWNSCQKEEHAHSSVSRRTLSLLKELRGPRSRSRAMRSAKLTFR
jgi:hypothetical protein